MTGRLPGLRPAELGPAQRALYDSMVANEVPWAETGRARAIAADGSLLGPFNPLLFTPAVGAARLGLFRADGRSTSLPTRVREIVILTVGAACQAAYELYAHRTIGKARGLPDATIEAITAGKLGQAGVVDMVVLTGLYLTFCGIVNAFNVPVPAGTQPESSAP